MGGAFLSDCGFFGGQGFVVVGQERADQGGDEVALFPGAGVESGMDKAGTDGVLEVGLEVGVGVERETGFERDGDLVDGQERQEAPHSRRAGS